MAQSVFANAQEVEPANNKAVTADVVFMTLFRFPVRV